MLAQQPDDVWHAILSLVPLQFMHATSSTVHCAAVLSRKRYRAPPGCILHHELSSTYAFLLFTLLCRLPQLQCCSTSQIQGN